MAYNWQLEDRSNLQYNLQDIQPLFPEFAEETGEVTGIYALVGEKTTARNTIANHQ